jgi:hypothetical protein
MSLARLCAIALIIVCTAVAWFILGGAIAFRTSSSEGTLSAAVARNWGPELRQEQPALFYEAPTSSRARREMQPESSEIHVQLVFEPKQKGLMWYRTYTADFEATYMVRNPTPIAQTIYASFRFPAADARYDRFALTFGDKVTDRAPVNGEIRESQLIPAGAAVPLKVSYRASGINTWTYSLATAKRVRNFHLTMNTNFSDINIPAGAESPTKRHTSAAAWDGEWEYSDVLGANAIAMDMPAVTNPGPVAGRITFFAPVSLLFFFAVLVIVAIRERLNLHPMNFFFLAAGCFAFQLLFAYLVDLLPLTASFFIAAAVSLALVVGYLWRAAGAHFARIAALAQFAYMILFSYSFFFQGLTGITITVGAIVTLALLMAFTARVDWSAAFSSDRRAVAPPPLA